MRKIILSHSGKQHSYRVALLLKESGCLEKFFTSSYIGSPLLQTLIEHWNIDFLSKRFIKGLHNNRVESNWRFELKEQLARRIGLNHIEQLVCARDEAFDHYMTQQLKQLSYDIFWGFQGSCFQSLQAAQKQHKATIYEMTTAYYPEIKEILKEERCINPEWQPLFEYTGISASYEKRLIEEPIIAKNVIALSSFLRNSLTKHGINGSKIHILPLGADVHQISYNSAYKKIQSRPLKLLFVGRITQVKGISYLIEAMRIFDKKDVRLTIVGSLTKGKDIFYAHNNYFEYIPHLSQSSLFQLYQQYDVLVLPSLFEGFGLVVVEALAAGLPVIATENTNAPDILVNYENGIVIPIRDVSALQKAITHFRNISDDDFNAMRRAARRTALQFSWEKYKENTNTFINTLII